MNYIIATSAKTLATREKQDPYSKYVLQYHLKILNKLLETTTLVRQVTIGCQIARDSSNEYYNIEKEINEIRKKGIIVVKEMLPNDGISYLQYVRCYKTYPTFDYYLIMEDDWCINTTYTSFDTFLIDLYKKAFPTNKGFLNCWSPSQGMFVGNQGGFGNHPFHSAITLGLLSNQTIKECIKHLLPRRPLGQLEFSQTLLRANQSIVDLPQMGIPTQILFYLTSSGDIKDYTESETFVEPFFVPVQYYYKKIYVQNMITNVRNLVENRENPFHQ